MHEDTLRQARLSGLDRESKDYKTAVKRIFDWQYQPTDNFYALLLETFDKADELNSEKLLTGFPVLVSAFADFKASTNKGDFFQKHGLLPRGTEESK